MNNENDSKKDVKLSERLKETKKNVEEFQSTTAEGACSPEFPQGCISNDEDNLKVKCRKK